MRRPLLALLALLLLTTPTRAQQPVARALPSGTTCYEIFVRSFADSDGDGVGDLRGLQQRFDYINDGRNDPRTSLGARCIWLMPIMASPSYHGYDVSDYYRVQPAYGTLADVKSLLALAHRRGVRVLLDMVINHTSDQHPFYRAALADTSSPYRAFYRFAPTPGPNNRWGDNNWRKSPLRDEYVFAFFSSRMPDLNYERPEALAEMQRVARFWLRDVGADGLRMDAVKFLAEEGPRVDDTPATHRVLREYAAYVRRVKPTAFTIGEVWDSTGAMLSYYPDQLDSYFAFEMADSIIAGVRRGDARGILSPVLRLQSAVPAARWGNFLRNHDQARTVTELGDDPAKAALAATIQLTLPGLPFVYYGEELGMRGPKPDERIRTPMAWRVDAPHAGFSVGTPWQPLGDDSLSANVEAQAADTGSLLALYRRLVYARTRSRALAEGALVSIEGPTPGVLAYLRRGHDESVLVVVNLGSETVRPELRAPTSALPPGRYALRDVLGRETFTALVAAEGPVSVMHWPAALLPQQARVVALRQRVRK